MPPEGAGSNPGLALSTAPLMESNRRYGTLLRTQTASGYSALSTEPRGFTTEMERYMPELCAIIGSSVVRMVVRRKLSQYIRLPMLGTL